MCFNEIKDKFVMMRWNVGTSGCFWKFLQIHDFYLYCELRRYLFCRVVNAYMYVRETIIVKRRIMKKKSHFLLAFYFISLFFYHRVSIFTKEFYLVKRATLYFGVATIYYISFKLFSFLPYNNNFLSSIMRGL